MDGRPSAEPFSAHNRRDSAWSSGSGSHDQKHQHAMENFKELLMKCVIKSTPNKSLTPSQKSLVEQRLQESFPHFTTPDHPPYSWMIQNAIEELNEEGGSNEEAIAQFIVRKNNDLPWAHKTLLEHHLRKLCESGELVENLDKYYLLGGGKDSLNPISSPSSNPGASPSPAPDPISIPNPRSSDSPIPIPSHRPSPSPSTSPTLSSSPSYSDVHGYISSSTSSSDSSFSLKRKPQMRKRYRQWNRGAKGIKVRSRCTRIQGQGGGRGRGQGHGRGQPSMKNVMEEEIEECGQGQVQAKRRGRSSMENMVEEDIKECGQGWVQAKSLGRGRGRARPRARGRGWAWCSGQGCGQTSMENMMEEETEDYMHQMGPHKDSRMEQDIEINVDHIEATEKQDPTIEIAAAEEHVRLEEQNQVQGNANVINVQCRAEQNNMVSEIEPHVRENRISEERIEPEWQGEVRVQTEETKTKWKKWKKLN